MSKKEWVIEAGKHELEGKGFKIVYAESISGIMQERVGTAFGLDKTDEGGKITAIVVPDKNKYYVLKGDFRKELEKLLDEGVLACVNFYNKNKKHISLFSTDPINETPEKEKEKSKILKGGLPVKELDEIEKILAEAKQKIEQLTGLHSKKSKINVTPENRNEICEKIKEITGCGAFILIMSEEERIPTLGSSVSIGSCLVENVHKDHVKDFLIQTAESVQQRLEEDNK